MRTAPLPFALAALSLAGCPKERPEPIVPVKIGVLSPLSGALAGLGPAWEDAVRLAAEEVNAGGGVFDGRPLELVFRDSATSAATAVTAAQELVAEGVVGMVGPGTSGESGAVLASVMEPAELPMISCCATAAGLTAQNPPNGGFFFRTTPSDNLQGTALAYLAKNGFAARALEPCPTTAFVHRNDAYGEGFFSVYAEQYVGQAIEGSAALGALIGTAPDGSPITYGTPEDEASLAELEAAADALVDAVSADLIDDVNPNLCVVVVSFDTDGGPVVARIHEGLQELIATRPAPFALSYTFLVGDGANSSAFAAEVGAEVPLVGTVPYHADNEAYARFSKAYRARYQLDSEPIAFSAQSYDALFLMALAITKARSTVGTDIRNALYDVSGGNPGAERFEGEFFGEVAAAILDGREVDYVGPSGEATFNQFGDVVGDYVLWQVEGNGAGGFRVVEREALKAADFSE
ncbi:MAG: ABC transporter substrate-binding protein [Deltaproteobacteria bacterium]|nr:ABC transporter substrate-binding protein [Deltaproteobacteria bacterium]